VRHDSVATACANTLKLRAVTQSNTCTYRRVHLSLILQIHLVASQRNQDIVLALHQRMNDIAVSRMLIQI